MKEYTNPSIKEFGEIIRERRKELGLTPVDLEVLVYVSVRTILGIECGKANPTWATVDALLQFLGITMTLTWD